MKRVFWKVGSSDLELIGRVSVNGTNIEIAADGDLAVGLVNGYRVVDGNLYEDPIARIVPAMAPLMAKIFRDSWTEGCKVTFYTKDWDSSGKYPSEQFMVALREALVPFLDEGNVCTEDEVSPLPAPANGREVVLNASSLVNNLVQYQAKLANTARFFDRTIERASVLTRRKLVASMWGADKVQGIIDRMKDKMPGLQASMESVNKSVETGIKAAQQLHVRITSGAYKRPEDLQFIGRVLIPSLQESHDVVQRSVAKVVADLAPFITIDKSIRVYTGSPASFFLPTNVLEDFRDAFSVLVSFLSDVPQMESGILLPLDYLKGAQLVQKNAKSN